MSPQMIQKLPAITLLEGMFPELSTNQLKVCVFYAMGVPYDAIAQNCRLSPETVRTYLKRSLKNLNLEGYDALRSAVLMRTFVFMISNTPRFYVSTSKSIIKALINMHSFEIQLSPIG